MGAILALLSALSLAAYLLVAPRDPTLAFYWMPFRFWELGLGCLLQLALVHLMSNERLAVIRHVSGAPLQIAAIVALALVLAWPGGGTAGLVLTAVATSLLLIGGTQPGPVQKLLTLGWVRWIGLISYSLYLYHWPVLTLASATVGVTLLTLPVLIVLMLGAAFLSYTLIETRLRRASWSASNLRTVAIGLAGSGAAAALFAPLIAGVAWSPYLGQRAELSARGPASLKATVSLPDGRKWNGTRCLLEDPSATASPPAVDDCSLGHVSSDSRVLVLGNSHAAALVPTLDVLARQRGLSLSVVAATGVEPGPGIASNTPFARLNREYWTVAVPRLLSELDSGDTVLVVADMNGLIAGGQSRDRPDKLLPYARGIEGLAQNLARRNIRLIVLNALPPVREASCTPDAAIDQWFKPLGPQCAFPRRRQSLDRRAPLDALLARLAESGNLRIVDLFDAFCDGPVCDYEAADGTMLYRDEYSHPSLEAAAIVGPALARAYPAPD